MGLLTREAVLASGAKVRVERVNVPEWGDGDPDAHVFVRGMNALERDRWDECLTERRHELRAYTLLTCVCDESGKSLFNRDDLPFLLKLYGPVERCLNVARRLSGMGHEEEEAIAKNSEGQAAGS